jgi:hypothetical protein
MVIIASKAVVPILPELSIMNNTSTGISQHIVGSVISNSQHSGMKRHKVSVSQVSKTGGMSDPAVKATFKSVFGVRLSKVIHCCPELCPGLMHGLNVIGSGEKVVTGSR